ncbi:MAG: hypothetical protein LBC64_03845 [Fibromonadaceae bacterium]|jgi:hypothetical protein|nr:hypothetical protein [Fibromonadaceae bacterium]
MKKSTAILLSILLACTISYADDREHFYGEWRERYQEWMESCDFPATETYSPNRYKTSPTKYCEGRQILNPRTFVIQTWYKTKDGYVLYFEGGMPLPFLLAKTKNRDIIIKQLLVDIYGNPGEPEVLYRIKR